LELDEGARRARTEDAIDPASVEPQASQAGLQDVDVVAAQMGSDQLEVPVTEAPRRLDERQPGGFVAAAVVDQAALALEGTNAGGRGRTERSGVVVVRAEARRGEAPVEVADGVAALTDGQREETRNSSSSWSS